MIPVEATTWVVEVEVAAVVVVAVVVAITTMMAITITMAEIMEVITMDTLCCLVVNIFAHLLFARIVRNQAIHLHSADVRWPILLTHQHVLR